MHYTADVVLIFVVSWCNEI